MSHPDAHGKSLRWVLSPKAVEGSLLPLAVGEVVQTFLFGLCIGVYLLTPARRASGCAVRVFLAAITSMNTFYTGLRCTILVSRATRAPGNDTAPPRVTALAELMTPFLYIGPTATVQIFFAIRVVKFLRGRRAKLVWLAAFVAGMVAILVGWGGAAAWFTTDYLDRRGSTETTYAVFEAHASAVGFFATAFVDILITATLVDRLRRNIVGFNSHTDSALRRVCRMTLASGSLTAAIALTNAVLQVPDKLSGPATVVHDVLVYPRPSLACLSAFWALDLRSRIRRQTLSRPAELTLPLSLRPNVPPDHSIVQNLSLRRREDRAASSSSTESGSSAFAIQKGSLPSITSGYRLSIDFGRDEWRGA